MGISGGFSLLACSSVASTFLFNLSAELHVYVMYDILELSDEDDSQAVRSRA